MAATEITDPFAPRDHNIAQAPLKELLLEECASLAARCDELLRSVVRAPVTIRDEEGSGKVADLVRMITACRKAADTARVGRTEPFLAAQRLVMATYKQIIDPLDAAKRILEGRLTSYQRAKAEEERRRREAEARRAAEEAARLAREAEEAARAAQTEPELDTAITAEAIADQAQGDAVQAQRAAEVRPAELSRTRGDFGAVASLRTFYDFADLDRDKIDLETLRPFIPLDAIEKSIRAYIRSGGRELKGCRIFMNSQTAVR